MENAICFEKHDGVYIIVLKDDNHAMVRILKGKWKSAGLLFMGKVLQN